MIAETPESETPPARSDRPDNPLYIQLNTQLRLARSEMKTLKEQRAELGRNLAIYEGRLRQAPETERQFLNLRRNYDNARAKYQEIKGKELEAELAVSLETERKSERFSLIEPPQLPQEPIKPNRPAIMFIGFIGAMAAGVGIVFILDLMDQAVYSARELGWVLGYAPLAIIPYIETQSEHLRKFRRRLAGAAVSLAFVALAIPATHFLYKPLDVLWFAASRRFGL